MTKSLRFKTSAFYAPGAAYQHGDTCTLLRNPHIARNEELQLSSYDAKKEKRQMRHFYFRHLTDLVMVDSTMLAAERLGGADYDGDMVKTIADPILNECVRRNYEASRGIADDALSNEANIPLLMIPSATPLIRSAEDWEARFEVVRGTSPPGGADLQRRSGSQHHRLQRKLRRRGAQTPSGRDRSAGHSDRAGDRLGQERHPPGFG